MQSPTSSLVILQVCLISLSLISSLRTLVPIEISKDNDSDEPRIVFKDKAPKLQPEDEKEDSRNSLNEEEEKFEEINMGENKDIRIPGMQTIDEDLSNEIEDTVKVNDKLDSFIVNLDYFGDEEKSRLNSTTEAPVFNMSSQDSGFLQENGRRSYSVVAGYNQDHSPLKQSLETDPKVLDSSQILEASSDTKAKKYDVSTDDEYLTQAGIVKGTKEWREWWKKKRSNCEDLLMAAEAGNLELVKSLLDKTIHNEFAADLRFEGLDDFTALHFSAQENKYDVCKFLIESGADLEAKSSIGRTPLHLSTHRGNSKIVELLADSGADLNSKDFENFTPLHYASEMGNIE